MTATINASTSSGVVITPDNSGNILLQYNGVAAPAFSAYLSANQNITAATYTKVLIDTKTFDTANCFSTSTNRFTPTVAGYYSVTAALSFNSTNANPTNALAFIYKNGAAVKSAAGTSPTSRYTGVATGIIYLNGTTDYLEAYVWANGGTGTLYVQAGGAEYTYFDACLLRGA